MPFVADLHVLENEQWDDFQLAEEALRQACEDTGFAARRYKSDRSDPTTGEFSRYTFICSKGGSRPRPNKSHSKGQGGKPRRSKSTWSDCKWSVALKRTERGRGKWHMDTVRNKDNSIRNEHNHEQLTSEEARGLTVNRSRHVAKIKAEIITIGKNWKLSMVDLVDELQKKYPTLQIRPTDVQNILARARLTEDEDVPESSPGLVGS